MRLSNVKNAIQAMLIHNYNLGDTANKQDYLIPYMNGGVGIGKTSVVYQLLSDELIVKSVKKMFPDFKGDELGLINFSLAQYDPSEIAGWLVASKDGETMKRLRPSFMPLDGYGIIFVDEVAQATLMSMNILGQLVDERRLGEHYLPKGWMVVSAGNRLSDRAGSNKLPSQLRDRFTYLDVEANTDDVLEYYAKNGVDHRINSWLKFDDQFIHKFDASQDNNSTPRSIERAGVILGLKLDNLTLRGCLDGQIGAVASASLMAHIKLHDKLPDFDKIISDPMNTAVPEDRGVLYALCGSLGVKMTKDNADPILQYIQRIPEQEFMAFMLKDAISRNKTLVQSPAVRQVLGSKGSLKDLLL
jgi:hypothetical protein|tara:strand:- start:2642 stop:3718 length:1077 start_codon:yes stop_codon:yes gene_type:complete